MTPRSAEATSNEPLYCEMTCESHLLSRESGAFASVGQLTLGSERGAAARVVARIDRAHTAQRVG